MGKSGQYLGAALTLALLLSFTTFSRAQDALDAPEPATGQSEIQTGTPPGNGEAAEPESKQAPAAAPVHHTAKKKHAVTHKKHAKKKKAHKAAAKKKHTRKKTKKKTAAHHPRHVKKNTASTATPKKAVEQQTLAPAKSQAEEANEPEKIQEQEKETAEPKSTLITPAIMQPNAGKESDQAKKTGENEEEATEPEKTEKPMKAEAAKPAAVEEKAAAAEAPAPKKSKLAAVKESHKNKALATKEKAAAKDKVASASVRHKETAGSAGNKSVNYTFCLGYDNCAPYRYEAMVHNGTTDARVFKQNSEGGGWVETKIDPVMESDLGAMARSESGNDVSRPLTVTEKARIADHQGKAHVDLVSAANDGRMDQVKQMMRDLSIKNANDLEAYDPRLARNDTAMQAANELAAGR